MLLHQFYIENNDLLPVEDFIPNSGVEIYEVVRVTQGIPIFIEDHLTRFHYSARLLHLYIPLSSEDITSKLKNLIEANDVVTGNIRFSYCFRPKGRFTACFIPYSYPTPDIVRKGVKCGLLHAKRNDPNVKVIQGDVRKNADKLKAEKGYFEALLVNEKGLITEGSRSNLFFVKEGKLITAPDEFVLPGITRKKIIEIAEEREIPVLFEAINYKLVPHMESLFITGTSPKVLPVSHVDHLQFKVGNKLVADLINAYDRMIESYIDSHSVN